MVGRDQGSVTHQAYPERNREEGEKKGRREIGNLYLDCGNVCTDKFIKTQQYVYLK